jgi:predicted kinase
LTDQPFTSQITEPLLGDDRVLVITRGLPASGKTTWAKTWVEADSEHRVRLNRDDFRLMMWGQPWGLTFQQEEKVTLAQHAAVEAVLKGRGGSSVVVDDTNLKLRHARVWADLAARLNIRFQVVDFTHVDVDICIARDRVRANWGERSVGEAVIRDMHMRFLNKRELPPVEASATVASEVYVPDESLPPAWLVDVDGTLALHGERNPFDLTKVLEDTIADPVRDLVQGLAAMGFGIVVMSGREDSCRQDTWNWLTEHGIPFHELHMRETGDHRNDSIVKREMFMRDVAPRWNVRGSLDDRDRVVAMWRELGLTCAQVASGDF